MNPVRSTDFFPKVALVFLGLFTIPVTGNTGDLPTLPIKEPNGVGRYPQPILSADPNLLESRVFNPSVIVVGDRLAMLYRADVKGSHGSRIQLAFSDDGRVFVPASSNPVLVADGPFDERGCEDPRVVSFDGVYYMTYVGNGDQGHQVQCLATSTDLTRWEKKGVVLHPARAWDQVQVKAAVIVPEKIGGKYIMYFAGQTSPWRTSLGMAVSDDLLHWSEPLDHAILAARPDHFDSLGVEPGATPIILPSGILLVYNGWDREHVHKTGWVLLSKDDPSKVLRRCEVPFIEPQFPYEMDGRNIFTFTEGAVYFKGLWRFYYGAADKSIGLAELDDISTLLEARPIASP